MLRSVLALLLPFLAGLLEAQVPTFKKRHGTSGDDEARFVEVLSDNSFIVAGSSTAGGLGGVDAMLVKFNEDGTVAWSKAYGGSGNDFFMNILVCNDGNYIALGETNSIGAGNTDIYVVKFDGGGNVLWERTCGGNNTETARGICEVSDGYIVTGGTQSFGNGFWDIFVEKLDLSGAGVWSKAWGSGGGDIAGEPLPASNGEIWVTGFQFISSGNHDGILLRLDANGTLQSGTRIGGGGNDATYYLTFAGAGLSGSGSTWTYTNGAQLQPWITSFNTSGGFVWSKRYLLSGNTEINAEDCPDGGFIFAPFNINNNTGDAFLVKTDNNGNITWTKAHSYNGNGRMYHARPCTDGGFVAVGHCSGSGRDMFILKTDDSGNVAGCCPIDAPITAIVTFPSTPSTSPGTNNGPAAGSPSGQDQSVSLDEVNICNGPPCACITDAGTMLPQTLHACINEPATLTHNGDEVLDNDDLLQFILFSDLADTLGSIVAVSNTHTFTFNPATMQTGVMYYVAAIAGNNAGGNVDLNDPCFDISDNAAQLIWHPLPEVELQTDNSYVCPGDCRTLMAVLIGTPPFTLTVTSPAGTTTVVFQGNTGTFEICLPPGAPPGSFTVQATALTDAYCTCE
jgi:hypothetical protein